MPHYNITIGMKAVKELTADGIEALFGGEMSVLQIIQSSVQATSAVETEEYLQATLSDGFAFVRKAWISMKHFPRKNYELAVIRIKGIPEKGRKRKDGVAPSFIINPTFFQIELVGLKEPIGKPIAYKDYCTSGKINAQGSRKIPMPEKVDEQTEDDFDFISSNLPKGNAKANVKKEATKQSLLPTNNNKEKKPATKPIEPKEPTKDRHRQSIKPQINHDHSDAEKIRDLFLGIENFKLIVRLLFIWPVKAYVSKKGKDSELLNMEFGDSSGTIMCTVFGETVHRYSNLEVDKVYSINGATVAENTYKNKTQLKLNLNEGTKLMMLNSSEVPKFDTFCLSVQQLSQSDVGSVKTVVCYVRSGELIKFVSKAGNSVCKKVLTMYDLENQVTADLTLFGDSAQFQYEEGVYAFKGIQIDQFQGNKNYKGAFVFQAKPLPRHPMSKFSSKIDSMEFTALNPSKSKGKVIDNFKQILSKCENLKEGENVWSEVICSMKAVKYGGGSKVMYLSCPQCKKKVEELSNSECIHCSKYYDNAKYRYILSINFLQSTSNLWLAIYDDLGEKLLALDDEKFYSADLCAQQTEQQVKLRIRKLRYKKFKLKIVSSLEKFNTESRVKHRLVKILDLDYAEQCKNLLEKLKNK